MLCQNRARLICGYCAAAPASTPRSGFYSPGRSAVPHVLTRSATHARNMTASQSRTGKGRGSLLQDSQAPVLTTGDSAGDLARLFLICRKRRARGDKRKGFGVIRSPRRLGMFV